MVHIGLIITVVASDVIVLPSMGNVHMLPVFYSAIRCRLLPLVSPGAAWCRPVPPGAGRAERAGRAGRAARCRPVPPGAARCRPVPPSAAQCRPVSTAVLRVDNSRGAVS